MRGREGPGQAARRRQSCQWRLAARRPLPLPNAILRRALLSSPPLPFALSPPPPPFSPLSSSACSPFSTFLSPSLFLSSPPPSEFLFSSSPYTLFLLFPCLCTFPLLLFGSAPFQDARLPSASPGYSLCVDGSSSSLSLVMPPRSPPVFGKANTVLGGWRGGHPRTPRAHAELRQEFLGGAGGAVSGRRTEGTRRRDGTGAQQTHRGRGRRWRGEPVPRRWQLSLHRGLSPPGAAPAPPPRRAAPQGPPRSSQPRVGTLPSRAALPCGASGGDRGAAVRARGAGQGCARGEAPAAAAALAALPAGYF